VPRIAELFCMYARANAALAEGRKRVAGHELARWLVRGARSGQSSCVSGADHPTVEDAIALAAQAHRGQRYASSDAEPYVFHPLRVMLRFTDPVEQMAAVLHDTIEDTDLTIDDLAEAGYTADVVAAIECLTRRGGEEYEDYIDRVARNDVARCVKIADLNENIANSRRLPNSTHNEKRIERYERALDRLGTT
jgi:(p)ppGpp synthase/HD superfamily hydrolase